VISEIIIRGVVNSLSTGTLIYKRYNSNSSIGIEGRKCLNRETTDQH
jgi:hypothetical protein